MERTAPTGENAAQIDYWNGPAGEKWARLADEQELMLGHLGLATMDACDIQPGHSVLDVGCGSGITSFQLARRVGENGHVLGIDISAPMLEVGRKRLAELDIANVTFETKDAATYPFAPQSFARVYSRFGVMFFADPAGAFSNIRRGMTSDGRLTFVCWQAPEKNQWMEIPLQVAHQYLPPPPAIDPDAPSPTAFANSDRVHGILADAGFSDITIDAFETKLPIGNDVADAVQRLFEVGPASRLLSGASDDVLGQVRSDLGDAILDCQTGDGVLMECSTWVVNAEAGLACCSHRSTSQ